MYWREKLKYKWQNERKFKDKNLPEVIAKIRKPVLQQQNFNLPNEQVKLTWGMANFLPPPLASEDEASIQLHKEWLKAEFKKTNQNFDVVDLKMDITYPTRRKEIVTDNMDTNSLLQEYPFLKNRRQVMPQLKYYVFAVTRHFCFVLGRQTGSEIFVIQLQKYNTLYNLET